MSKPTIQELESMLKDNEKVRIMPDGRIVRTEDTNTIEDNNAKEPTIIGTGTAHNTKLIPLLRMSTLGRIALNYYMSICGTKEQAEECLNLTIMHVVQDINKSI